MSSSEKFRGFPIPESNCFYVPKSWFSGTADLSVNGIQVVLYSLRHTWRFNNKGLRKSITFDEFVNGVVYPDNTQTDEGCGLSKHSVRVGIQEALNYGFIEEDRTTHCVDRLYKICIVSDESESE